MFFLRNNCPLDHHLILKLNKPMKSTKIWESHLEVVTCSEKMYLILLKIFPSLKKEMKESSKIRLLWEARMISKSSGKTRNTWMGLVMQSVITACSGSLKLLWLNWTSSYLRQSNSILKSKKLRMNRKSKSKKVKLKTSLPNKLSCWIKISLRKKQRWQALTNVKIVS